MARTALVVACLAGSACVGNGDAGSGMDSLFVVLNITGASPLAMAPLPACPQAASIGGSMTARVDVGGVPQPVEMTVDPETLRSSGSLAEVTRGIVRPLGLRYSLANLGSEERAALAVIVGFVDIRDEVAGDASTLSVDLTGDGVTSMAVVTNAALSALPAEYSACADLPDDAGNLCRAEAWMKDFVVMHSLGDLDTDADGTSNMEEACAGTLFN